MRLIKFLSNLFNVKKVRSKEEIIRILKDDFFNKYKDKYKLTCEDFIGQGHYACVFKGYDLNREIDVAIKIFFDGIVPKGSERGWHITSSVVHNQIVQTSTIESFNSETLNLNCKAVIQRLIPGKSLKKILEGFDSIENLPSFQAVLNDFGLTYLKSLLDVLNFCHNQGFGHGDCHDGNIMVYPENHETKHSFKVVLIDFDNSSIKETLNPQTEKEKIESDLGLFKYFFDKTFYQWKFHLPLKELFSSYDSITEIQFSYSIISAFIENCIKDRKSKQDIENVLQKLPHPFMGFQIPPTIKCLETIAESEHITNELNQALEDYKIKISKSENWQTNIEIEYIEDGVIEVYLKLFG